jgi:hypothetical protein
MGKHQEASDILEEAGRIQDAKIIKAVQIGEGFHKLNVIQRHETNKSIAKTE